MSAAVSAATPPGVSSADIAAAVEAAVESAAGEAVTAADIVALVGKAVEDAVSGGPTPLSASEVQGIVAAAIAAIPTPAVVVMVATPQPVLVLEGIKVRPGAKRGGVFRLATYLKPAHFDLHQSATVANLAGQAAMYETLVRANPLDGGRTIVPDLAESWEVSNGGLTYTLRLRQGVKFHNGATLTADDVVATFEKIVSPPTGITSIREALLRSVVQVEATDPLTVRFELSEPNAIFLPSVAISFNAIVLKKTLEENNLDLRRVKDYPGTGPFRLTSWTVGETLTMDRFDDYWNAGLPYLDQLQVLYIGGNSAAAVLVGQADFARAAGGAKVLELANKRDDINFANYKSFSAYIMMVNNNRDPWNNPKVRQAIHLALDRKAVTDATRDIWIYDPAYWLRPDGKWGPSSEETLKIEGWRSPTQADIEKAKRLMAEAGYANGVQDADLLCRQGIYSNFHCAAFQAQLKEALDIEMNIRVVDTSVWFEDAAKRNFDLTMGAVSSTMDDPSDAWNVWWTTDGAQSFGGYSNPDFDRLMEKITGSLDEQNRRELIEQGVQILEKDMPGYIYGWEAWVDVYSSDVKGQRFDRVGLYTVNRWDNVWLDR